MNSDNDEKHDVERPKYVQPDHEKDKKKHTWTTNLNNEKHDMFKSTFTALT